MKRLDGTNNFPKDRGAVICLMNTVIVTGVTGLIGPENVKYFAREGFKVVRQADLRLFPADCRRLFKQTSRHPKHDVTRVVSDVFERVRDQERELEPSV